MSKFIAVLGVCAAMAFAFAPVTPAFAQGMGQEATIKGEVVDTACFLFMGKRGETHELQPCAGFKQPGIDPHASRCTLAEVPLLGAEQQD